MILMKTKESFMITNARNVYECTILRVTYWHFYLVDICAQPSVLELAKFWVNGESMLCATSQCESRLLYYGYK